MIFQRTICMTKNLSVCEDLQRFARDYEQGRITLDDAIYLVSMQSAELKFFECLECLPADIIDGLKDMASDPPPHPEDIFHMAANIAIYDSDCDIDLVKRQWRWRIHWAHRRITEHYFPGLSMRPFESILHVGHVKRHALYEGRQCLVISGESAFNCCLAYDHPVLLATPAGDMFKTRCAGVGYHVITSDEKSAKCAAMIIDELYPVAGIPVGTAVRVDRSLHSEIPLDGPDQ